MKLIHGLTNIKKLSVTSLPFVATGKNAANFLQLFFRRLDNYRNQKPPRTLSEQPEDKAHGPQQRVAVLMRAELYLRILVSAYALQGNRAHTPGS